MVDFPKFDPLFRGAFVERPNRFLVRCDVSELGVVEAHMPNPGRMRELLLPGVTLYLTESIGPKRKTRYTVMAVERDGSPVFLHTGINNKVAHYLLESGTIPGLKQLRVIRPEFTVGSSRFDFLVEHQGQQCLLEVKSVTLFGNNIAMFPDAITDRGRRHLEELSDPGEPYGKSIVLFLVHHSEVKYFLSDYHTDLAFSETLYRVQEQIDIVAVAVGWTSQLTLKPGLKRLTIPWDYLRDEMGDRGALIVVAYGKDHSWIWVEDVQDGLAKKTSQYKRGRFKSPHPLDVPVTILVKYEVLPIRSSKPIACLIASQLAVFFDPVPLSQKENCKCVTHLFKSEEDPQGVPAFQHILEQVRLAYRP
ncbi:MAG: DNA/RNA nuclease SfsA [Candidatus Hydrogenedentota bacterium]|nr:MAG: DNA/RNA nuclease SfsA [Candidatus Hydrogenedentota bacterium]